MVKVTLKVTSIPSMLFKNRFSSKCPTSVCSTLPSFYITCRLLFITSAQKFSSLTTVSSVKIVFGPFGTSHIALISTIFEKQKIKFNKIRTKVMGLEGHSLYNMLPKVKNTR